MTLSAATEYDTRMPEEKRIHYLHRFHLAVEERETALEIAVPDEHLLQEMEEKLRALSLSDGERSTPRTLATVPGLASVHEAITVRCVSGAPTSFLILTNWMRRCIGKAVSRASGPTQSSGKPQRWTTS